MMQHQQMQQQHFLASTNPSNMMSNRVPLRRAVYVKVADLISTYKVDPAVLDDEIARVNAERENLASEEKSTRLFGGIPSELDTSIKKRLQPPRGGNNMVLLVGKVRIVVDKYRVDSSRVRLAVVEVGDESGCVSLRARDEQIDTLVEIANRSGAVVLRNCTLELYQGKHIRLAVTKWGKILSYPDHIYSTPSPPSIINYERSFSMINLSLIADDASASQSNDQYKSQNQYHGNDNISQGNFTNSSGQGFSSSQHRRERRPSRGTSISGMSLHSYQGVNVQNSPTQYSGQQPYAGVGFVADTMSSPQYYTPQRQSEISAQQQQQQQILYQQQRHQYELQQQQMHMYHRSPMLESQQGSMRFAPPPLSFQNTVVSGSSFQGTYPQSAATAGHQQQVLGSHLQPQQQFIPVQHPLPPSNHNGMNAQAATYAPNASSHDEQPTH